MSKKTVTESRAGIEKVFLYYEIMKRTLWVGIGIAVLGAWSGLHADTVEEARKAYNVEILMIEAKGQDRIDDLYRKYAGGVARLRDQFQADGNLDNTIKANKELELALEEQEAGTEDFPGIERMRAVLADEEAKIRAEVADAKVPVKDRFVKRLEVLKVELTKAGKLEEALAVRDDILELKSKEGDGLLASSKPQEVVASPRGMIKTPRLVDEKGGEIPILPSGKMGGEIELTPEVYRLQEKLIGGDGSLPKESKLRQVTLTLPEGTILERETLYLDEGHLIAEGSRFRQILLSADLGGTYEARRSLFDDVIFAKGGAWMSGYSAKIILDHCVLYKSNFRRPGKPAMGFKITNTTFVDCDLDPIVFKEGDDPTREAQGDWLTVENCHFIDCVIPQSFLYITKNCLFENCRFGSYEDLKIKEGTKNVVTLYHGSTFLDPPKDRDEGKFKMEDGTKRTAPFGAGIEYEISGGALDFR